MLPTLLCQPWNFLERKKHRMFHDVTRKALVSTTKRKTTGTDSPVICSVGCELVGRRKHSTALLLLGMAFTWIHFDIKHVNCIQLEHTPLRPRTSSPPSNMPSCIRNIWTREKSLKCDGRRSIGATIHFRLVQRLFHVFFTFSIDFSRHHAIFQSRAILALWLAQILESYDTHPSGIQSKFRATTTMERVKGRNFYAKESSVTIVRQLALQRVIPRTRCESHDQSWKECRIVAVISDTYRLFSMSVYPFIFKVSWVLLRLNVNALMLFTFEKFQISRKFLIAINSFPHGFVRNLLNFLELPPDNDSELVKFIFLALYNC